MSSRHGHGGIRDAHIRAVTVTWECGSELGFQRERGQIFGEERGQGRARLQCLRGGGWGTSCLRAPPSPAARVPDSPGLFSGLTCRLGAEAHTACSRAQMVAGVPPDVALALAPHLPPTHIQILLPGHCAPLCSRVLSSNPGAGGLALGSSPVF